jgi:pyruvate-formate lyase-activating enzyme
VPEEYLRTLLSLVEPQLNKSAALALQYSRCHDKSPWTINLLSDAVLPPSLIVQLDNENATALVEAFLRAPVKTLADLPAAHLSLNDLFQLAHKHMPMLYAGVLATDFCNLHCTMCQFHSHSDESQYVFAKARRTERKRQQLPPHLLRHYLEQLPKGTAVLFSSTGEYLTYRDAPSFIMYAAELGLKPRLLTNGMLLDDRIWDILTEARLEHMIVSAEGYDAASYAQYRLGGSLDVVMANIARLREKMEKASVPLTVSINSILFPDIAPHKEKILELWRGKVNWLTFLVERVDHYSQPTNPFVPMPDFQECFEPLFGPLILSNGYVVPCCTFSVGEWFEHLDWLLSIEDHSLAAIQKHYAELALDPHSALRRFCRRCSYKANSYLYDGRSPFTEVHPMLELPNTDMKIFHLPRWQKALSRFFGFSD